jgi:SpoVK/Ycf46/Vps4 family AAA+-type ATPase
MSSLVFGVLFVWHARGERAAVSKLVDSALAHMVARNPREVAEADSLRAYEAEAVRQAREAFEEQRRQKPQPHEPREVARAIDARGQEFRILE